MAFKCKPDLKCWCGLQVAEPVWASEAGYCDEALTRRQLAIYDFLAVGWPLVFCSTPSLVEGRVRVGVSDRVIGELMDKPT